MNKPHGGNRGNINKIKYYLPGCRNKSTKQKSMTTESKQLNRSKQPKTVTKRHSGINEDTVSGQEIPFEIVGLHEADKEEKLLKRTLQEVMLGKFPEGIERELFYKFLGELKNDKNYQNTITMFTIMYFYDKNSKLSE